MALYFCFMANAVPVRSAARPRSGDSETEDDRAGGAIGWRDPSFFLDQENLAYLIAENLPSLIGYWDSALRCRYANIAYLEWFGRKPTELIGLHLREVLGEKVFALNEPYARAALGGAPQKFERTLIKPSGEEVHTLAHYVPDIAVDDRGETYGRGFFVLVSNITEIKQLELSLREANERLKLANEIAESANQAKSEFLASVSHELLTPLNAITGFAELLEGNLAQGPNLEYAGHIKRSSERLHHLISNVLNLAWIESGEIELRIEPTPLTSILLQLEMLLAAPASSKGVQIRYPAADPTAVALVDATQLLEVFAQLGANAIEFNKTGGSVVISLSRLENGQLRVSFADTGVGVAADRQRRLFGKFDRLGQEAGARGSVGVGLSISRKLTEMMGGSMGFRSELSVGSEFWVDLPAAPVSPALER